MQVSLLEHTQVEGGEEMKAALYARVSSEEQVEGYSIDAQIRAFETIVEARGWTIYKGVCRGGQIS
jgi:site-specific DNA recombinase